MKEYIERDKLLEVRKQAIFVYENANILKVEAIRGGLKPLLDAIVDVPTTDVREVVHAKWIKMHGNLSMFFKCSKCGACNEFGTRYCPDCGAKMDLK